MSSTGDIAIVFAGNMLARMREVSTDLVRETAKRSDCSHFTRAVVLNAWHTSTSDKTNHWTVAFATDAQIAQRKCHVVHIYFDKNIKYAGHQLFPERDEKEEKKGSRKKLRG